MDGKLLEKLSSMPLVEVPRPTLAQEGNQDIITPRRGTRRYTREDLLEALRACKYEIAATADHLGLVRGTLQNQLRRYGIRTSADLTQEKIIRAYRECGGNLEKMVVQLEVSGAALRALLKTLGLQPDE
ncbi:MAG TPA: helix-turn-helix domain-containing protein [Myxococcales bacterium]|nr:helix-turn-helix domain-containing protein [Myxococcales bacterium]